MPTGVEPVLAPAAAAAIQTVLEERERARELSVAGIEPTKTILLAGPPGSGKTMTAVYLAASLQLPLVTVELAGLMSSFLGRTGQNLRYLLDFSRDSDCVVLLDEFDALAKRRDDVTDVGELKRIVNVLLLELERWPPTSLLIAATNHVHLLDPAIDRRFDLVIELGLPDVEARRQIVRQQLAGLAADVADEIVVATAVATDGLSGADLERLIRRAARASVVRDTAIGDELAALSLERLRTDHASRLSRAVFSHLAHLRFGMSQREIARLLGVSHPTVAKLVAEADRALSGQAAA